MPESKAKTTSEKKKTTTAPKRKTSPKKTAEEVKTKSRATEGKKTPGAKPEEEDWGEKLSAIADKAFETVKIGVQKLSDFASESSQVAKIKFEILNLSSDRKSLFRDVGQKLWKLHKEKSLGDIEGKFEKEFQKLAELERQISKKEKEVEIVSQKEQK